MAFARLTYKVDFDRDNGMSTVVHVSLDAESGEEAITEIAKIFKRIDRLEYVPKTTALKKSPMEIH